MAEPVGLELWHKFIMEGDTGALSAALTDTVMFRSPFVWRPKSGKDQATLYLTSAARVLKDFTYHRQFSNESGVVLEFTAHIGDLTVKGVDIIEFGDDGRIVDFEVMVRPATGLQALAAAMQAELALTPTPSPVGTGEGL